MTEPVSDKTLNILANHIDQAIRNMAIELRERRKAEREAKPVAWMWDQAKYRDNDVRGRGWFPVLGKQSPTDYWMVRNVVALYHHPAPQNTGNEDEATRWRHGEKVSDYEAGYKDGLRDCEAGFVKVPVEPDSNMTCAGTLIPIVLRTGQQTCLSDAEAAHIYMRMIAARPKS